MPDLRRIPAWTANSRLHVVVEAPRGARAKLEFDPELATLVLSKRLSRKPVWRGEHRGRWRCRPAFFRLRRG